MSAELDYGVVTAIDYKSCCVRCRLDDRDGVETYWLHVPQRNSQGVKRRPLMPELGEQLALLIDDDGVSGVVLGGVYSSAEPPPIDDEVTDYVRFRDGTVVKYNQEANTLDIDCVGTVNVATKTLTATADVVQVKARQVAVEAESASISASQSSIKGNVGVEGNLEVNGNIHATGSIMDDGGNSNHHSH